MNLPDVLNSRYLPLGIDLSGSVLRVLQFRRRSRGLEVASAVRADLAPPGGSPFEPGSDAHVQAICSALQKRVAAREFHGRSCVITLDDRLVRIRSVRLPRMPDDELDRAVAIDAPGRLGFSEKEAAEVAWIRAGEVRQGDDFRDEIIMIGASRDPTERLVFGLAAIGLRPLAVEPSFAGVARAYSRTLRRNDDQDVVKVIADIGTLSTGVTIIRGQSVVFHKPIEIGGDAMTKAAATRLGLEYQSILDLRRQRMSGAPIEARVERAMFEAIRPTIMDIANEVSLCLRYFGVSFRGMRTESCIVTGRDAAEPQLAELVGEVLRLPTAVGNPFDGIDVRRSPLINTSSCTSEWAVAAGLGLRSLKPAASRVPGHRRQADGTRSLSPARREAA
ncbi:MAG: pilus assembly protein PilM [Phycisphaerae bacterium]|nr:pilus assembly protein PilM [Phycisphaerae bacterium]